jgi:hypothetical protein
MLRLLPDTYKTGPPVSHMKTKVSRRVTYIVGHRKAHNPRKKAHNPKARGDKRKSPHTP